MPHILVIASGLVHAPLDELQGQTPLAVAKAPYLTTLASRGVVGRVRLIPDGMESVVDVGALAALGYDPAKYYTGRGPLEAAGFGVSLRPGEVAFRCHLVTESEGRLADETAGGIATAEAAVLIEALNTALAKDGVQFHAGAGHRHVMVVRDPAIAASCVTLRCPPPHAVLHKVWERALPRTDGGPWLGSLLRKAHEVLSAHEVNQVRLDLRENPANFIWCWGQGPATTLPPLSQTTGGAAAMVSGSHAVEGAARLAGVEALTRSSALGHGEAAYHEMARALLRGLKKYPLVIAYAPLVAETATPRTRSRIAAIELFDRALLGPLMEAPSTRKETSWLVVPACGASGVAPALPFAAAGPKITADPSARFDEATAAQSALQVDRGYELLTWWLTCGS